MRTTATANPRVALVFPGFLVSGSESAHCLILSGHSRISSRHFNRDCCEGSRHPERRYQSVIGRKSPNLTRLIQCGHAKLGTACFPPHSRPISILRPDAPWRFSSVPEVGNDPDFP